MNIKYRKLVLIIIIMLANIITTIGIIVDIYYGNISNLFKICEIMSLGILIFISLTYLFYCIAKNITRVRIEKRRNRYFDISENQDILYEWNRRSDTIVYSANIYAKYSIEMIRKNFMVKLFDSKNILEEYKVDLVSAMKKLIQGSPYEQVEVRLKKLDGSYSWVRVSGTAILGNGGELRKIVGAVIDIDEEKTKNKELIFKAERDSLTKIYNRVKFVELVNDHLNKASSDKKGYLIMIDLDNFKMINDNLGHIYGDKALIEVSKSLKAILNEDELIGRLGGDELCIFIEGSYEESYILKRVDEMMNAIVNIYIDEHKKINISASIGIAQYPKDGLDFEELYIKSDRAMYNAKKKGKGRYVIYDEG